MLRSGERDETTLSGASRWRPRSRGAAIVAALLAGMALAAGGSASGGEREAKGRWEPKATQLTQFRDEAYSPTRPDTPIRGTYVTGMTLGAMAGRSAVLVQCVFTFQDWKDDSLCGTGKVRFTATIAGESIFDRQTVRFSHDRCHRSIWYSTTADLSGFDAADEFVCTARVKDKAKLQPVDSASISYQANLKDLTWAAKR